MISHEYRCIFIHIPRCGGSSIEGALGHYAGRAGRGRQDHRTIRHFQSLTAGALTSIENAQIVGHRLIPRSRGNRPNRSTVGRGQYQAYFKFAVVRDPWSRAYSAFRNLTRDRLHRAALGIDAHVGFEPFLRRFIGHGMLRPQTYWLKDFSGRVCLDFVCRFEHLDADFREVCRLTGMPDVRLPHLHHGGTDDWREHYTPRLVDLVAHAYAEEIGLFGFAFDPVAGEALRRVA